MEALVSEWLSSRKEQLSVFEGDDEIILKRQAENVLLAAQASPSRSF